MQYLVSVIYDSSDVATDEDADISLVAAVLEDCGDRVLRRNRASVAVGCAAFGSGN